MYVRFPLSLRNAEDLHFERGFDICHETVLHCWYRFGPMIATDIMHQRVIVVSEIENWQAVLAASILACQCEWSSTGAIETAQNHSPVG